MRRTIKFRKKRIPERDIYDPITVSYFYSTISDHELLKAAFVTAEEFGGVEIVKANIRDANSPFRSVIVFEMSDSKDSWFIIVSNFLGRTSKYIEKVKW